MWIAEHGNLPRVCQGAAVHMFMARFIPIRPYRYVQAVLSSKDRRTRFSVSTNITAIVIRTDNVCWFEVKRPAD
jgi:hypothetical protein